MSDAKPFQVNLNLNVRGLPVSATLGINELSNRLLREGRQIFKFGLGQSPFPVPLPVVETLQANAHQKDYLPVRGLPELQRAVAEYYQRTQHLNIPAENVLVGPGSKELMFILQLAYYGDLVIPTPSWVSYAPQAHILGRHVHWLRTAGENRWLVTPEELEILCRQDPTKPYIVILNYPNNPTGCSYSEDELQALADVARKYRIVLLSDEIYGELNFAGTHTSIARYYPEGTIISSGLSKWCGAGGWRLGTFAFPETLDWLIRAMAVVASETFTATSAPIQYAAVRAFRGGTRIEEYLEQSRRVLQTLSEHICRRLAACGAALATPQGAFYMFPDFSPLKENLHNRGIRTSSEMCERLLAETGVAILPGSAFGRPAEELTARLAFVDFDGAKALAMAGRHQGEGLLTEEFLQTCCFKVVEGIERLCQWLHA